jgi:NTP pyrophosphatase (non-canonical NTP hydrolase)
MRKEVERFANAMEMKLQKYDEDKGTDGWKQNKDDRYLQEKLLEEVAEYFVAWNDNSIHGLSLISEFISAVQEAQCEKINCEKKTTKEAQQEELADIGNIAMMLYDNLKPR